MLNPAQTHLYHPGHVLALLLAALLLSPLTAAQELEPRMYINLPIDQNFGVLAYGYSDGNVNVIANIPLTDAKLSVYGPLVGYARTFAWNDSATGKFDVSLPYTCADGSALSSQGRESRRVCGTADGQVRLSYNFYGAPPLALAQFAQRQRGITAGASLQLGFPSGKYSESRVLNIGANRWFIKPEIGASIPLNNWHLELAASAKFYTDNPNLQGHRFSQEPVYNLQSHLIWDVAPKHWLALDFNYFFGGESELDGIDLPRPKKKSRLGGSWSYAINNQHAVKLFAHTGIITRVGNDSDSVGISWTYRWQ